MGTADIAGAKASNAGDDFHVLWALQRALKILDQGSNLTAVTVEGLPAEDEAGAKPGAWDGVDVGLFYGGTTLLDSTRVEIAQLKYSTASSTKAWTVARLCESTKKKPGNNSVIAKLAGAYAATLARASHVSCSPDVSIKLVSNQPISDDVLKAIQFGPLQKIKDAKDAAANWAKLHKASGLNDEQFRLFAQLLDFTDCQGPSRFAIQEKVIQAISAIAATDSRAKNKELYDMVFRRTLPEAEKSAITKETVLTAMYVADGESLFPCPSRLKSVDRMVPRDAVTTLLALIRLEQRVCMHGGGGCGKTTAFQELQSKLPPDSEMIIFDCYGGGRYLDSDGQRHRPSDAFLHLSNELATRLGAPMLVSRSSNTDYLREFKIRLKVASSIIGALNDQALLVIAIDAADNAITAAQTKIPEDACFVRDIVTFGEIPRNVRFLISARTGRLPALPLPGTFKKLEIGNFKAQEFENFVRMKWEAAPRGWIENFHSLSGGNPRVISYAFDYAGDTPDRALAYLQPSGKDLPLIFGARVNEALLKVGNSVEFSHLCAGLIILPRPIPVEKLAMVIGIAPAHIKDICADLAPGIVIRNEGLGFADEDFEEFIRDHAAPHLDTVRASTAQYFMAQHEVDVYAAEHVAAALLATDDRAGLLALAQNHPEPLAVKDPIRRREIQLHRLKLAMRVAREAGQTPDVILVLLRGAHALRTDRAVRSILTENIDMAAQFAQLSLRKIVLFAKDNAHLHGKALVNLMLAHAKKGEKERARAYAIQFHAWLAPWGLDSDDIATQGEALLRIDNPEITISCMRKWRPRRLTALAIQTMSYRLIASDRIDLVEECLLCLKNNPFWSIFLRVPLALAGNQVDVIAIERNLSHWVRRGWVQVSQMKGDVSVNDVICANIEQLLVAAEVVVARTGDLKTVQAFLEIFITESDRQSGSARASDHIWLDAILRAHALIEQAQGRKATTDSLSFFSKQSAKATTKAEKDKKKWQDELIEKLKILVSDILPFYNARAVYLLNLADRGEFPSEIALAVSKLGNNSLTQGAHYFSSMRDIIGRAIASLLHVPDIDEKKISELACTAMQLKAGQGSVSPRQLEVLRLLCYSQAGQEVVLERALAHASLVAEQREAASDRTKELMAMARLIGPISHVEGNGLFGKATAVLDGIDYDEMFGIKMLEGFAQRARSQLNQADSRAMARKVIRLAEETRIHLGDVDGFPWESIVRTLTHLDPGMALAVLARWDDTAMVSNDALLTKVLMCGLANKTLDVGTILPLLPLIGNLDGDLMKSIELKIKDMGGTVGFAQIADELARIACLNVDAGDGIAALSCIAKIESTAFASTPWLDKAKATTVFYENLALAPENANESKENDETKVIFAAVDKVNGRFTTALEIQTVVADISKNLEHGQYLYPQHIFDRMRTRIRLADRLPHILALAECLSDSTFIDEQIQSIASCILDWREKSSAVAQWCEQNLPSLLSNYLPSFCRSIAFDHSPLPNLLAHCGLSDTQISRSLIAGLENHADSWNSYTVYTILGRLAGFIAPADAALVLKRHLALESEQSPVDSDDIPFMPSEAVGRFLYAYLGDAAVAPRWNAAHGLRIAARLGRSDILKAAFAQYERKIDSAFRDPKAQFYWLAARLWLMIAAERIANEVPGSLEDFGKHLTAIACDAEFPHLLIRHFAKGASQALVRAGVLDLNPELAKANSPRVNRAARADKICRGFSSYHEVPGKDRRRFDFDISDTLSYWYSRPIELFADVEQEEFLEKAEAWIIDKWQTKSNTLSWDNEPRKERFDQNRSATSHHQGALPSVERLHTYLEWHALWCVLGELICSRPLVDIDSDDYNSWESFSDRMGLTNSPIWLSDLREPTPLFLRFWQPPKQDIDTWVDDLNDALLKKELGFDETADELIVSGYYTMRYQKYQSRVRITSALVSPATAPALLRAMQAMPNSFDYKIPDQDDELEINHGKYRLIGWLENINLDIELDQFDLLRREVKRLEVRPGRDVIKSMQLTNKAGNLGRWIDNAGNIAFRYVAWSDEFSEAAIRKKSQFIRSDGYRLNINIAILKKFLEAKQMDLLIEVDLNREAIIDNDYDNHDPTVRKARRLARVFLLRADGSIDTASGPAGTW